MLYPKLIELIQKEFFIIYKEKFNHDQESIFLDRMVAKHPLLRPEFIIVNDNIHGFKKMTKKVSSLEQFPIFIELEGVEEDNKHYLDHVELYCETAFDTKKNLSDLIALANIYEEYIIMDRVLRLNKPTLESVLIYSRIDELFMDEFLEEDMEVMPVLQPAVEENMKLYLLKFIEFIKHLDDLVIKKKTLSQLKGLEGAFGDD